MADGWHDARANAAFSRSRDRRELSNGSFEASSHGASYHARISSRFASCASSSQCLPSAPTSSLDTIRRVSAAAVPSSARSCAALSTPFGQDSARTGSQPAPTGSSSSSRHSHAASGIALGHRASLASLPASACSSPASSTPFGQFSACSGSQPAPPGSFSSSRHNVSHAASGIAPGHCASGLQFFLLLVRVLLRALLSISVVVGAVVHSMHHGLLPAAIEPAH